MSTPAAVVAPTKDPKDTKPVPPANKGGKKQGGGKSTYGKSSSSSSSSNASVYFLVVIVLFAIFGLYYWWRIRPGMMARRKLGQVSRREVAGPPGRVPDTAHREPPAQAQAAAYPQPVAPEKALATMYVPKEIGNPTQTTRVFLTNKGLRTYRVNEYGFPLPHAKPSEMAVA